MVPVVNVDCTEQVTAGKMVSTGRAPPALFNFERFGVASPMRSADNPTMSRTRVRLTRSPSSPLGWLPPKDRVALPQLGLIVVRRFELRLVDAPGLAEERDGVRPHDRLDVAVGDARLLHLERGLRNLERVAHPPVSGAVDDDAVGSVLLDQRHQARFSHLRARGDRIPPPPPPLSHA